MPIIISIYQIGYMAYVSYVFDNTRIFDIVRNTLNLHAVFWLTNQKKIDTIICS